MTSLEIHAGFVDRFGLPAARTVFTHADIQKIEAYFGIQLPASYCSFVTMHGSIRCHHRLLSLIVDQEAGLWDVMEVFAPKDVIEVTNMWASGGMSDKIISFASDSMGNLFGFERTEISQKRDDSGVWFFDHDFCTEVKLTQSFDSWLSGYLQLKDEKTA